jgi:hypothetical protein
MGQFQFLVFEQPPQRVSVRVAPNICSSFRSIVFRFYLAVLRPPLVSTTACAAHHVTASTSFLELMKAIPASTFSLTMFDCLETAACYFDTLTKALRPLYAPSSSSHGSQPIYVLQRTNLRSLDEFFAVAFEAERDDVAKAALSLLSRLHARFELSENLTIQQIANLHRQSVERCMKRLDVLKQQALSLESSSSSSSSSSTADDSSDSDETMSFATRDLLLVGDTRGLTSVYDVLTQRMLAKKEMHGGHSVRYDDNNHPFGNNGGSHDS